MPYPYLLSLFINIILIVNGAYDITCAFSILSASQAPFIRFLGTLHIQMFAKPQDMHNPIIHNLLAYWLLTYGTLRLIASSSAEHTLDSVAALTYFIESFAFQFESCVGRTLIQSKANFVSVSSTAIGILILTRPLLSSV